MWHLMVMPSIEPRLDSAKQEGPFASRSRSKPAKRSTTIYRNGVKPLVHSSSLVAVRQSIEPDKNGSIAMRRKPGEKYEVEYYVTPLETVAKHTRMMDPSYVGGHNTITKACVDYAKPRVGKMPVVGSFDELKDI